MAELVYSTIHPVRAIFMIVKLSLEADFGDNNEVIAGMAAWAAHDQGWSIEEIAAAMAPVNQNVIADLVYSGERFLRDAGPGREWLRLVASRANVYDRMAMVVIVTDRQEAPAGLQRPEPDDGSSARHA